MLTLPNLAPFSSVRNPISRVCLPIIHVVYARRERDADTLYGVDGRVVPDVAGIN